MSEQEKKDEKVGLAVSAGLHALLLLIFFFILAWRAPDPPLPDYGIELNFGVDNAGSGNEQPITPANQQETEEIENSEAESQPEPVQEQEVAEAPPVAEPEVVEEAPSEAATAEVVTQPEPTPVTKQEVKKPEPKPEPKKVEPKPVVKTEPVKEVIKEEPKPVVKPEPVKEVKTEEPKKEAAKPALFPGESENTEAPKANQGDREGTVGDQGSEEGSLDARALYGEQGGGQGGAQLSIAGWRWDEAPNKKDQSTENGKIVFRFKIDDQGYVIEANTIETTVGPKVTQFYREQLLRTTFSTTSNAAPAPTTTGMVTFVIKAR